MIEPVFTFYFNIFYLCNFFSMKTLLKKLIAVVGLVAMTMIHSAYASGLSLTGSTGTDLTLTGSVNPITGEFATGSLNVEVTATVVPTLTFNLSTSTLDLWELTIGSFKNSNLLEYNGSTNAVGWMLVQINSSGLEDAVGNRIGHGAALLQWATDYRFASSAIADDEDGTAFNGNDQTLHTLATNGAFDNDLYIAALIDTHTIAGNYTDTLVFTVTGNF